MYLGCKTSCFEAWEFCHCILSTASSHVSRTTWDSSWRYFSKRARQDDWPSAPKASAASCRTISCWFGSWRTRSRKGMAWRFFVCPSTYANSCFNNSLSSWNPAGKNGLEIRGETFSDNFNGFRAAFTGECFQGKKRTESDCQRCVATQIKKCMRQGGQWRGVVNRHCLIQKLWEILRRIKFLT